MCQSNHTVLIILYNTGQFGCYLSIFCEPTTEAYFAHCKVHQSLMLSMQTCVGYSLSMSSQASTWERVLTPLHLEGVIFNCISSESADNTFYSDLLPNTTKEIRNRLFSFAGASFWLTV